MNGGLSTLRAELELLEAETFEISDHVENHEELMGGSTSCGTSTSSTSTSSSTTSCTSCISCG